VVRLEYYDTDIPPHPDAVEAFGRHRISIC
jgi:hypothetical protein